MTLRSMLADTAALPAAGRAWRQARRLGGWLAELTRHHGIWAPGVRMLRRMDLRSKALLTMACVVLPLAGLMIVGGYGALRQVTATDRALDALRLERLLVDVERAAQDALVSDAAQPALQRERSAFARFAAVAGEVAQTPAGADAPAPGGLAAALADKRDSVFPKLPAGARPTPQALRSYVEALAATRAELSAVWTPLAAGQAGAAALGTGAIEYAARLRPVVQRLAEGLAAGSTDARRSVASRLHADVGEAGVLLALARPPFERAAVGGVLDTARIGENLTALRSFLDSALQQAHAATLAPEQDAAAAAPPAVDQALAARAVAASAELEDAGLAALDRSLTAARAEQRRTLSAQFGGALVGALLAGYLLVCLYKVVAGGLRTLVDHLQRMAGGDFSRQPTALGRDEVGRALQALSTSAVHISELLAAVTHGVSGVAHASREVATGNAGLAVRTRELRGGIEDVAQRTQSFTNAMDTCSQQIDEAAEHILAMRGHGQRSREAVVGLRSRMRSLQSNSHEIKRVIGLVESIAHQTKLLSLNASVESARAGGAGKGFAVVAQEVRALAERSEEAARRIQDIVSSSVEQIEDGNLLADRASDAVLHTDEKIVVVNQLVQDVVRLTQSGTADALQVLSIARGLEATANGNAQVVDQLSDASAALRGQGDSLKSSVQHFILE